MPLEIEDRSGLPTREDIDNAIRAVEKGITSTKLMQAAPELVIELPNIRRCLQITQAIVARLNAEKEAIFR